MLSEITNEFLCCMNVDICMEVETRSCIFDDYIRDKNYVSW